MHRNAVRVQEALVAAGSAATVVELPSSARTVAEAAASLGVTEGQIAKSLVFVVDGAAVLCILSGDHRLDPARLASQLGGQVVDRADADTVREATGFPIGGVSPVGHPEGLTILVDRGLAAYDEVWAAAGTPHAVFRTSFEELVAVSGGKPADVRAG